MDLANCGCTYHAEEGIPCEHDLRKLVFDSMANAVENGYEEEILAAGVEQATIDMCDHDSSFEDLVNNQEIDQVELLKPFVEEWFESRKK